MNIIQISEVFFITAIISFVTMPLLRQLALRTGFLDIPKQSKIHAYPIPLLGGIGIYLAFFIAASQTALRNTPHIFFIFLGSTILLITGLVDDKFGMMPNIKLLGQFLAALLVIKAGIWVYFFKNYYLNVIFTYIWIMGITNAFNLLDNMNGLSAGIAVITSFFFGIICFIEGQMLTAGFSLALAGACCGFLKHNFPKANIFMGDSGSLVVGYLSAILAVWSSWQTKVINPSLVVPFLVLSYPIFDTGLVTIIRLSEKRSIFEGGRDHSSHRLALMGLRRLKAVLVIYLICIAGGIAGVIVAKSNIYSGLIITAFAFLVFLGFGVRLGFVKTYQHGHRRKDVEE